MIVGLVTDPDQSTKIAQDIVEDLDRVLSESVSEKVMWDIRIQTKSLPLDDDGNLVVWRDSDTIRESEGWDVMVCLTELTRRVGGKLVLSDVSAKHKAGVVSLPALGPVRLKHHVTNGIVRVLRVMTEEDLQPEREPPKFGTVMRLSPRKHAPIRQESETSEGGVDSYLPLRGFPGLVRLLLGMVRINRPWRLVPSLSSALAAAAAAAAFGIFYSSIWAMADTLSPPRLLFISAISIGLMMIWLIFYNNLWQHATSSSQRRDVPIYNAATLLTLVFGVTILYVLLFAATFLGAMAIIPASYLEEELGHPVNLGAYAQIAWLSTSLGTMAGALGSSFESDVAIREATYGRREQERHAKLEDDDGG